MPVARRHSLALAAALGLSMLLPAAARATTLFADDFSDNSAGWTLGPEWSVGRTSFRSCALGSFDPSVDHSPTGDNGVAAAALGGCVSTAIHAPYYLTSPTIDLSGASAATLSFWRWLTSDYAPFMTNTVELFDGAGWTTVFQTGGSPGIADVAWTEMTFPLGSVFLASGFRFRIGHSVGAEGAFSPGGWTVDDVAVTETLVPAPVPIGPAAPLALAGLAALALLRRVRRG